ncbi:Peptidase [Alteracholeplasma palmae J233]|uniref:Peptidase n=1 Tax=Alteracholeplasma palmae (strain ATCC 49389 / J233) TaxID=1318466 RepID=U4KJQ0_ALTPJ|nr:Type 1 glutamine amidotransferase-like domain-containing protein [Alteracholeplasma palmae]CCV63638.1 Peptidase [Alteracholeplasma palmae J233]
MKKLYLTSSFKDVVELFLCNEGDIKGKTVTFIPTASLVEKVNFFVKSGKKALESLGLIVDELEITNETEEHIINTLHKNDYIYVTGGNTFFLLQELKRKNLLEEINKAILNGKVYIGESAGSIITSPNISYVEKMDSIKKAPELTNYDALNIVDFYLLPHHGNFPFKNAVEKIIETYQDKLELKAISNHEVIFVKDNEVSLLK